MLKIKVKNKQDYVSYKIKDKDSELLEYLTVIYMLVKDLKEKYNINCDDIKSWLNWYEKKIERVTEC